MKGWALFDRSVPTRLNPEAREYLVEIFEAGKVNRNHRVSPEEAEMKLKNRFPLKEDSWLTVKQVVICFISNIKKLFFLHSDQEFVQSFGSSREIRSY